MFAARYFAPRYYANRYFTYIGGEIIIIPAPYVSLVGVALKSSELIGVS